MTTQTIYAQINGPKGGQAFTATCTDDAWTELKDAVSSLSLYEVLLGMPINQLLGSYNAGGAMVRVRNSQNNVVKILEALPIVTEERTTYLDEPFSVQQYDIIEAFCEAVPT